MILNVPEVDDQGPFRLVTVITAVIEKYQKKDFIKLPYLVEEYTP